MHSAVARLELPKVLWRRRVVIVQLVQLRIARRLLCSLQLQDLPCVTSLPGPVQSQLQGDAQEN